LLVAPAVPEAEVPLEQDQFPVPPEALVPQIRVTAVVLLTTMVDRDAARRAAAVALHRLVV
jgi:hypothetical protein